MDPKEFIITNVVQKIQPFLPRDLILKEYDKISQMLRNQLSKLSLSDLHTSELLELSEIIVQDFFKSRVDPGKMVGIIAGQSLGEKFTQGSLNSVDWNELVIIKTSQDVKVVEIGRFIDDLVENKPVDYKQGDTILVKCEGFQTLSVDADGKVMWKEIDAVTRHLPVNKDGSNVLIKVVTKSGKSVVATKGKSFLVRRNNKIVPQEGDLLRIGDRLPVIRQWPNEVSLSPIESCEEDLIPIRLIDGDTFISRNNIETFIEQSTLKQEEIDMLKLALESDVFYDPVVEIQEVPSSHKWVYDFTIRDTLTFVVGSGIMMMDTFHNSGVSTGRAAIGGLPRLQELLGVTEVPKNPFMTIYLKKALNSHETRRFIPKLQYTTVLDVYKKMDIKQDFPEEDWQKVHKMLFGVRNGVEKSGWILRLEMDKQFLFSKRLSMKYIADVIESYDEKIRVVFSDLDTGKMDIYYGQEIEPTSKIETKENALKFYFRDVLWPEIAKLRLTGVNGLAKIFPMSVKITEAIQSSKQVSDGISFEVKLPYVMKHNISVEQVQNFILSQVGEGHFDGLVLKTGLGIKEVKKRIDTFDVSFKNIIKSVKDIDTGVQVELDIDILKGEQIVMDDIFVLFSDYEYKYEEVLNSLVINGMNSKELETYYSNTLYSYKRQEKNEHWFYETEGSNFKEVLGHDDVEGSVTMTNSLTEIYETLGIEAARQYLMEEFLANGADDVNIAHPDILADTMTYMGILIAMTRHGQSKMDLDFIAMSAFEENTKKGIEAGSVGMTDPLRGISASIMTGKLAEVGTNYFKLDYAPKKKRVFAPKSKKIEPERALPRIEPTLEEPEIEIPLKPTIGLKPTGKRVFKPTI